MTAPTVSAAAQAQAAMWASLAKAASTYGELTSSAAGVLVGIASSDSLSLADRTYLADLIDRDLNGWES